MNLRTKWQVKREFKSSTKAPKRRHSLKIFKCQIFLSKNPLKFRRKRKMLSHIPIYLVFLQSPKFQFQIVCTKPLWTLGKCAYSPENGQAQLSNASGIVNVLGIRNRKLLLLFKSGYETFSGEFWPLENMWWELTEKSLNLSEVTVTAFESEANSF